MELTHNTTSMDFYAYCLAEEVEVSAIEGVVGVAGKAPHVIPYDGIKAVTSEFADNRVEVTRDNVYSHERVIGLVTTHTTPLPFRFGTLVSAGQLDQYVESNKKSLLGLLARVHGSIEMSVKIISRPDTADSEAEAFERETVADGSPGIGAKFLEAKRREIAQGESNKERAEEIATWLARSLGEAVRESVVRLRPSPGLAVAAAHLVERERLDEYREKLSAARLERPGLYFLTSGPWPPYSFVDLRC